MITMSISSLILASSSPRRSELLSRLNVNFEVIPSSAEEILNDGLTARELCQVNAYRKARAVAKQHPDMVVLGADTLVYLGTKVYGKPATLSESKKMLQNLQGKTHQVVTAVCLMHLRQHRQRLFADITDVTFRRLNSEAIEEYIRSVHTLDKAGAYAIQEKGDDLVESISGSYSNVVGLPMERLERELEAW
jgi:septum formation protein